MPTLASLGLGRLIHLQGSSAVPLLGSYGKMLELSKGKDTTTGHWEMMGLVLNTPLPTYPNGFPAEVIAEFETKINRKTLGNKTASGTEIIKELGDVHVTSGSPIVYTSQDSVFQIAAHEEVIPLPELYQICLVARAVLRGEHSVGRVIARPFAGKSGSYQRTPNRHDYSLLPFSETVLDRLAQAKVPTLSVGKIWDIFAGRGIAREIPAKGNREVMDQTLQALQSPGFARGFLFANLVDFDMLYNHRQDPIGFMQAMVDFDRFLPSLLAAMQPQDVLMITADHGNDPTDNSTDHTREYVPLLVYGKALRVGIDLGVRQGFYDCGQTVLDFFSLPPHPQGRSFARELLG